MIWLLPMVWFSIPRGCVSLIEEVPDLIEQAKVAASAAWAGTAFRSGLESSFVSEIFSLDIAKKAWRQKQLWDISPGPEKVRHPRPNVGQGDAQLYGPKPETGGLINN